MKAPARSALLAVAAFAATALSSSAQAAGGPYQYFAVTPCRVIDTRTGAKVQNTAFANFTIKSTCGVPSDAVATSINVTVVGPSGGGFLGIWPTGLTPPNVSTINWAAGESAIANGAIVPLAVGTPDISVFIGPCQPSCPMPPPASLTTDLILDVTGYFK